MTPMPISDYDSVYDKYADLVTKNKELLRETARQVVDPQCRARLVFIGRDGFTEDMDFDVEGLEAAARLANERGLLMLEVYPYKGATTFVRAVDGTRMDGEFVPGLGDDSDRPEVPPRVPVLHLGGTPVAVGELAD